MILYHVINTYQLFAFMIYQMKYKANDKAILLATDTLINTYPQCRNMKPVFDDVWVYPIRVPVNKSKPLEAEIKSYFDRYFAKKKCSISEFSEIYLGCPHLHFGIYLSSKTIPYIFCEEANGLLSRPEILRSMNRRMGERYDLAEKYGLFDGTGNLTQYRMCDMSTQVKDFRAENILDYQVVSTFWGLTEKDRSWIIAFFSKNDIIDIPSDGVLLLTQHFANLEVMSCQDQILIYQMLVDYFFENENLIIKIHPSDVLYYSLLFPTAKIIRESFPSELLPILLSQPLKTLATISSTAIGGLRYAYDDIFELGPRFEKEFRSLHRIYAALKLVEVLEISRIGLIGINEMTVINLLNHGGMHLSQLEIVDPKQAQLVLVDTLDEVNSTGNNWSREEFIDFWSFSKESHSFVLINSLDDYVFYGPNTKDYWKDILPIKIKKERIHNFEFYASLDTETFYFYSMNERWRNAVNDQRFSKDLKHTGVSVHKIPITDEQKRVQVLEGILEATEKRLLHYIEREKMLMEKLGDRE